MHESVKAIVIREREGRGSDRLFKLLTESGQTVTALAKGVRRKNSPLAPGCQLLAYSSFNIFDYRGWTTIDTAEPEEMFLGLRGDLERMSLALYFCELLEEIAGADQANPDLTRLALNALYCLSGEAKPRELIKAAFELRLAALAGYEPDLGGCADCGGEIQTAAFFDLRSGVFRCEKCDAGRGIALGGGVLKAVRYILSADLSKLFSFSLSGRAMATLSELCEQYLLYQIDRRPSTLEYYKKVVVLGHTYG